MGRLMQIWKCFLSVFFKIVSISSMAGELWAADFSNLFHTGKHTRPIIERLVRAAYSLDLAELKWGTNLLYFGNSGLISELIQKLPPWATHLNILVEQRSPL